MLDSIVKVITGKVKIRGNTDGTLIGNTGDRLRVDTVVNAGSELKTFKIGSPDIAIGNNKSMLSLLNASGSEKVVKIREIYFVNSQTTSVTGIVGSFSLLRFTGHSGGTSLTALSYDSSDTLNGSITGRTGATISGEVASSYLHWEMSTDEWGSGAIDVEAWDHGFGVYDGIIYEHRPPYLKPLTLRAGEGFHVKQTVNSTAGQFDIYFVFTEE